MPSVESIIKDVKTLGATGQEEVCPHCTYDEVSRNSKIIGA